MLGLFPAAASGGTILRCGGQASQCGGFSCCGAQALGMRAWQFRCMGLDAPQHVGFFDVPCIGRQILNHWTTSEVLVLEHLLSK